MNLSRLFLKHSKQLKISFFCKKAKLKYTTIIAIVREKREFKENVAEKLRQEICQFWIGLGNDFGFFERRQQEETAQE